MYIKDYMSTNVITVDSDTPIHEAEKIMRDHKIRRLPVVDKEKLVGIITKDKIREATATPATSLSVWELNYLLAKMKVKDVMEKNIITIPSDAALETAVALLEKRGIGTLPVVDDGQLVGIATITDLYKIVTQALGFGQPGARLHVFDPSRIGGCQDVINTIIEQGGNILSLFHVTPPGIGKEDCIIRLEQEETGQIVAELENKGYEVKVRPR